MTKDFGVKGDELLAKAATLAQRVADTEASILFMKLLLAKNRIIELESEIRRLKAVRPIVPH